MGRAIKILRRSIFTFLQNYQYFTSTAALLALPFAAACLLSQMVVPSSSLLPVIQIRLQVLFDAAGFPPSPEFFTILNLKLSQSIATSLVLLPFSLSFFLFAKAFIIEALRSRESAKPPAFSSFISLYNPLLLTQLCNSLVILSANATCFTLLFFSFNVVDRLGPSSPRALLLISAIGAVFYSIVLANALIISNLALVLTGMEKSGGFIAILKACVLIRGKTATALSVAIPVNMALAGIEALFRYRIVVANLHGEASTALALEAMFIAYLYSIFLVLDTIVGCALFKSCKTKYQVDQNKRYYYRIEIEDRDGHAIARIKALEDIP